MIIMKSYNHTGWENKENSSKSAPTLQKHSTNALNKMLPYLWSKVTLLTSLVLITGYRKWSRPLHQAARRCWGLHQVRASLHTAGLWTPWGKPWSVPWRTPQRWTACRSPERSRGAWCTPWGRRSRSLYTQTKSYLKEEGHMHIIKRTFEPTNQNKWNAEKREKLYDNAIANTAARRILFTPQSEMSHSELRCIHAVKSLMSSVKPLCPSPEGSETRGKLLSEKPTWSVSSLWQLLLLWNMVEESDFCSSSATSHRTHVFPVTQTATAEGYHVQGRNNAITHK